MTVSHITDSGTPKLEAIEVADCTSKCAHNHSPTNHPHIYNNDHPSEKVLPVSIDSSVFHHEIPNVQEKNSIKKSNKTRLSPLVIEFIVASENNVSNARKKRANDAMSEKGISLKEATLELGYLDEGEFDERVDPKKMLAPNIPV